MMATIIGILKKLFREEIILWQRVIILRLSRNPGLSRRFGDDDLNVPIVILALMISVCGGTFVRAAEPNSSTATMQKYAKLPLSFERHGDSELVTPAQGCAIGIFGTRETIILLAEGASHAVGMEFVLGRQVAAIP